MLLLSVSHLTDWLQPAPLILPQLMWPFFSGMHCWECIAPNADINQMWLTIFRSRSRSSSGDRGRVGEERGRSRSDDDSNSKEAGQRSLRKRHRSRFEGDGKLWPAAVWLVLRWEGWTGKELVLWLCSCWVLHSKSHVAFKPLMLVTVI